MKCTICEIELPKASRWVRCESCRAIHAKYMQSYRDKHGEKNRAYQRGFNLDRRKLVLRHYGGACECCGENRFEFLALDHKNGSGNQHRKEVKQRGANMIGWVIANNFPPIFRVLCHNCNSAIGFYGSCPHQRNE